MQEISDIYDVIIIGGGPAGLTAALYTSRSKLKTVILDKSATAGALAYSRKIENYPGLIRPVSGKELLDMIQKQAAGFGAEYTEAQVVGVNLSGDVKEIVTMDKTYSGKTVIIATGSMGRKPGIKGEAEFLGKGVSYCAVCDAPFFKGKTVCVIGNSEEAIKEAAVLTRFAETVYLISPTRDLKVDDHPGLKASNLKVLPGYTVTAILPSKEGGDLVGKIRMSDTDNKETELELSGVFIYLYGSKPITDFLYDVIETGEEGCIRVNPMMETSIPGVFAAGDVTCTKVRQVVVAASHGCIAALSAEKYISQRKKHKLDWRK